MQIGVRCPPRTSGSSSPPQHHPRAAVLVVRGLQAHCHRFLIYDGFLAIPGDAAVPISWCLRAVRTLRKGKRKTRYPMITFRAAGSSSCSRQTRPAFRRSCAWPRLSVSVSEHDRRRAESGVCKEIQILESGSGNG